MSVTTVIPLDLVGYEGSSNYGFANYNKVSYTRAGYNNGKRNATACYIPEEYRAGLRRMYNSGSIESISITITWTKKSGGGNVIYYGRKLYVDDEHCEMEDFDSNRRSNFATSYGSIEIKDLLSLGYPSGEAWVFGGNAQYDKYVSLLTAEITVVSSNPVPAGGFNGKALINGVSHNIASAKAFIDGAFRNVSADKAFKGGTWK